MKLYKSLIAAAAVAVSAAMTGCDDDFDRPPVIVPEATIEANTTILDLKERYWQDPSKDYMTEIGKTDDGKDIIIGGIIVSDDAEGNVYQRVIVQDETSAIAVRVYSSDLSSSYHYGQEVRINVTGLLIGTYRGLMMIGVEYNGSVGGMDADVMAERAQVNGLPNLADVYSYPVTIPDLVKYKGVQNDMMMWQTRLVTIENVSFVGAGTSTFGTVGASNYTTTQIKDADGNTLDVSTSNKCNFAGTVLPTGTGTVTAILSYFGSNWQLCFNDPETECVGFEWVEKPTTPDTPGQFTGNGTKESPFTVDDLIAGASTPSPAYVTGYIVGWVNGQVLTEGATFTVPATVGSNVLLASAADCKDVTKCVPVQLVSGSTIRSAVNLMDNPGNLGKVLVVQGSLEKYFGVAGVKSPTDDFTLDGQGSTPVTPPSTSTVIYSGLDATAATIDWTLSNAAIWTWKEYNNAHYLNASGYGQDATLNDVMAVSPVIDLTGKTSAKMSFEHAAKFQTSLKTLCYAAVREAGTTTWTKLTIPTWPPADSWTWASSGDIDLSAWAGKKIEIAFAYGCTPTQADTWEIRNLTITE